ncbi:MAG: GvpL/GvpF family gas vesicle protein [Nocardioidaceae bacterium]|nr:GvpL/GvpF family gas vesicle protein [Nocardioidaceae bacterium]
MRLYAVTGALPRDLDTEGWSVHRAGSLAVLHAEVAGEEPGEEPGEDETHEAAMVVDGQRLVRLARQVTLLPVRYGSRVADLPELEALVADHRDAWERRLAAVEGCAELLVRVGEPAVRAERPVSGHEYLRQRARALEQGERRWDGLVELVRPWARELRVLSAHRRLAALVSREQVPEAREAVGAWAGEHPEIDVTVTGPWPPFSFCEEPRDGE